MSGSKKRAAGGVLAAATDALLSPQDAPGSTNGLGTTSPLAPYLIVEPTPDQARQFALMIMNGFPAGDAIQYFYPSDTPLDDLRGALEKWQRSERVKAACRVVAGGDWQDMTLEEKITFSINKHYAELAYYLYSHNYSELDGGQRQKADTCRQALEAKLAGLAGKMDPLTQWLADIKAGKWTGYPSTGVKPPLAVTHSAPS